MMSRLTRRHILIPRSASVADGRDPMSAQVMPMSVIAERAERSRLTLHLSTLGCIGKSEIWVGLVLSPSGGAQLALQPAGVEPGISLLSPRAPGSVSSTPETPARVQLVHRRGKARNAIVAGLVDPSLRAPQLKLGQFCAPVPSDLMNDEMARGLA